MARNYILGGMAGTQLQAGKPYFKRIHRKSSLVDAARTDGLTCKIDGGKIVFGEDGGNGAADPVKSPGWSAGELLMVKFPTTLRSVEVQMEDSTGTKGIIRAKVMLTAPNQDTGVGIAQPVANGNYIEIVEGDTATISSRTKVIFILIEKFTGADVLDAQGDLTAKVAANGTADTDAVALLITGVLDHEPTSGGSQAANEPRTEVIEQDLTPTTLRKIWGKADGVG